MGVLNSTITIQMQEPRPCWVKGRRAVFHRWTDTARAVVPHGLPEIETEVRYQLWNVHGLVEYEDGTVERVWPQDIVFPKNDIFIDYDWNLMEHERDQAAEGEPLQVERDLEELLQAVKNETPPATAAVQQLATETLRTAEEPEKKPGGVMAWLNGFKRAAAAHEEIMADAEKERGL